MEGLSGTGSDLAEVTAVNSAATALAELARVRHGKAPTPSKLSIAEKERLWRCLRRCPSGKLVVSGLSYSITSSARESSEGEMVMPSSGGVCEPTPCG